MEIRKAAQTSGGGVPTPEQLAAINQLAKTQLQPEQVYVFSLRLCDDQIDRDYERFDPQALPVLAKLFVGKTGILDHCWSTENQVARIFATEVVAEKQGSYLKAWAYIPRSGAKEELIGDIEAGIKKEVSIGCAMGQEICSICGKDYGTCGHQKGEYYDGVQCCGILREPVDAYEFSFVAVPAQRQAGVLKTAGGGKFRLKELAERYGAQEEWQQLQKQAQLGRKYRKELEDQVVRLGLALELGAAEPVLRNLAQAAAEEDLSQLKAAMQDRFDQMMPPTVQLRSPGEQAGLDSGFMI